MFVSYAHFSTFSVAPGGVGARILFPALQDWIPEWDSLGLGTDSPESLGYVRSDTLIDSSWKARNNAWEAGDRLEENSPAEPQVPFRDYPKSLRTPITKLLAGQKNVLAISARNVLSELSYTARIAGRVYRTARQLPIPGHWPALSLTPDVPGSLGMRPLEEVDSGSDLLTGLPLVINGTPLQRHEIISKCSDVSHSYRLSPEDYFGASGAWKVISNQWHELHTRRLAGDSISDAEMTLELDRLAAKFGYPTGPYAPGVSLPHSIAAQRHDGQLDFLVLTTGLPEAARFLSQMYASVIVLDNSGSIGHTFADQQGQLKTILSCANHRPEGTCFVLLDTGGFLGPHQHSLVN